MKNFALALLFAAAFCPFSAAGDRPETARARARHLHEDGNYREAEAIFRQLALDPATPPREAVEDLADAVDCLVRLGEQREALELLAMAAKAHPESWRVLAFAADGGSGPLFPRRRPLRHGIQSEELFRPRALRLLLAAEQRLDNADDPATDREKLDFYSVFQQTLRAGRLGGHAWRLTALTDLDAPAAADMTPGWALPARGAPVDGDGNPIYHRTPASWDAAANDGERWRWVLGRMEQLGDAGKAEAGFLLGQFLTEQFGVQTLREMPGARGAELAGETGPFAVRTLEENETIARLAGGVKRFAMPDEFNHILVLRRAADAGDSAVRGRALALLASIFENRQQYPKAADFWRRRLRETDADDASAKQAEEALARITGNSGELEPGDAAAAGKRPVLSYLFRNGDRVSFTATRLDEKKLLADIRDRLKAGDNEFLHNSLRRRPEMLADYEGARYLGDVAAEWEMPLSPLPDHFSRRIDVEAPIDDAGCYLVEARMRGGNASRVVVWISDLALALRDAGGSRMAFVADAAGGEPVAGAVVSFLGIARTDGRAGKRAYSVREFAEKTDGDGLLFLPDPDMAGAEWLIRAETPDGKLAYLGFDRFRASPRREDGVPATAFFLTDRPVYRPGQVVHFKGWIGRAAYTPRPGDSFAGREVRVRIHNPRGDVVQETTLAADAYGGVDGAFTPEEGAALGQYYLSAQADGVGGGAGFRVEEYKKPEFSVSLDAPDQALALGDSVQLKVRAAYYHGSPVTDAAVAYRILRTPHGNAWIPSWRWDWLYGAGAWQTTYTPGMPRIWPPFSRAQPELVAEGEGRLDAEGVFRFTLDTAPAKALFGDEDHAYAISFDVTDASRRVISGTGRVVAAREAFAVNVWTEGGYFRANAEICAEVKALTPMGAGVAARGEAVLSRISYADPAAPEEVEVERRDVGTDANGTAVLRFRADAAGQYRLLVRLREEADADGRAVEGAALLTVRGEAGEGDFRFSPLELVPDKREYAPGETVRLAVNSENNDGIVLLFPRAERMGGAAVRPQVLRLRNGTRTVDLDIRRADQPNFFCEAITVFGGKIHTETREIFVPPADKTLRAAVTADKENYLPGETATFSLAVTDAEGNPVAGQCAVSLYDKSVEYIAGGSGGGDIRAAFWSWKRFHNAHVRSSLDKQSRRVRKNGDKPWMPIGAFGREEADWNGDGTLANGEAPRVLMARAAGGGEMDMAEAEAETMAMAPAPMAAPMMADAAYAGEPAAGAIAAESGGAMAEAAVRSEFADTAFWSAALETDDDGKASFTVVMPENLTTWVARAWVMGTETRVGDGVHGVVTRKNVLVRPQTPRFLTQTDQVVLSANLHNYLPRAKRARAELVLEGGLLAAAEGTALVREIDLAAGGEARVDWLVDAVRPGTAGVTMKLLTDEESDAAALSLPVLVHGARRVENFSAVIRPEEAGRRIIRFTVPQERLPDQSRLEFSFSPSIALPLLEALPYLIDYPYGCTEQTLNRFLPAVMVRKHLDALGVSLADAKAMLERAAANEDRQNAAWREHWRDDRAALENLPVFDDAELDAIVRQGAERLAGMQNADGGWGWFSGEGERSWPHTTAVVMHGLAEAEAAGLALPAGLTERGARWLARHQEEQIALLEAPEDAEKRKETADSLDAFIHLILVRTAHADARMRDFLYRDRLELPLSALAMLGLSLEREGRKDERDMVMRNLSQFVETNGENATAWLRTARDGWWRWYNDGIETQAWYLLLLAETEPHSERAAGVAKYLLHNRKNGAYWRSTRDTAYAVRALARYAAASGEAEPDMTVRLFLDGKQVLARRLTKETLLADNRFVLSGLAVEAGDHELVIERAGAGALYGGGMLSVFSLEDPIPASGGGDLRVSRAFYRLTPSAKAVDAPSAAGTAVRLAAEQYDRTPIPGPFETGAAEGGGVAVAPGDLIEAKLTVTAANDYEYLVFEDRKAAGLEAVELRSGYAGNALGAYVEYRDDKVALFLRSLPRGTHTITYRFRAETPGRFSALPVFGGGMYATDLFCNSEEMKLRVEE